MTQEEIVAKAVQYTKDMPDTEEGIYSSTDVSDAYIDGIYAVLESEEYKRMELDAERWKAYIQVKNEWDKGKQAREDSKFGG